MSIIPHQLAEYIKKRRCIAFVGAGFSRICGMPDWAGLMLSLLEYCQKLDADSNKIEACRIELDHGNLVEAADTLRDMLQPAEYGDFLKDQFSWDRYAKAPTHIHDRMKTRLHNLEAAPWAGIITTNFDELIGSVCNGWFSCSGDDRSLGYVLSRNERFYVRLHSATWNKSKVILSSEDYYKVYLENSEIKTVRPFLKASMLSHQFVFIGCSLETRLLELRKELYNTFDGEIPVAYALLSDTQQNRDRAERLVKFAIRPIFYKVESGPNPPHQAVDQFLEEAAQLGRNIS
ncbi:MAG: SIR2 family protein [Luteolibacter sp.]|uniref:SIR2 family protein n=1 Tax=Luteolibacter sp. TaxID=1962973 RepID=UPI00326489DA